LGHEWNIIRLARIIYITVRTPLGSFEEFIIPEMVELRRRGHALRIVPRSPAGDRVTQAEAEALQDCCVYQPMFSWAILRAGIRVFAGNPRRCLNLLKRIILRSGGVGHLVKNLTVFPKALWLAQLAKTWKADHLHAHWLLSTATMAMVAGEVAGIPWSCTAHRGDIVDNNMLADKMASAAFVRFISWGGMSLAQSLLNRPLPPACRLIHMGVNLPGPSRPPAENQDRRQPITLMCPALLLPVKGHIYLLQALAALAGRKLSYRLLLAGQGPLENSLRRQVDRLGIQDRVTFLGHLTHSALLQYYEKRFIDLVVLPSIDLGNGHHEGIPVCLMEAMAYGIPVIATATGSIPELIDATTGILVPPKDWAALSQAIQRLMGDTVLRHTLARAGQQRIKAAFTVEHTAEKLAPLFARSALE
jgi:colanic acid/amylovoran biosynthesis glycosyltransferase